MDICGDYLVSLYSSSNPRGEEPPSPHTNFLLSRAPPPPPPQLDHINEALGNSEFHRLFHSFESSVWLLHVIYLA